MEVKAIPDISRERLGTMISLVLLGQLFSILVPLPSRHISLQVLGSALSIEFSGSVQLTLIMGALMCAGVDGVIRAHPQLTSRSLFYTSTFWSLPTAIAISSLIAIHAVAWRGSQIVLIAATGIVLTLVALAQYRGAEENALNRQGHLLLKIITYFIASLLYFAVYSARLRSMLSASGILMISAGLSLELYRHAEKKTGRIWLYSLLTGLGMSELTWGLNYTRISGRMGGALLLLAFYMLTGLTQQHLWGRLTRRVTIEYGVVGIGGLALVAFFL